jgi:hypothetical protein
MTLALSLGAVLLGTTIPIVGLLLLTRWRLSRTSILEASRGPRLPNPVKTAAEQREPGLPWLRATIGPPPASTSGDPRNRSCPRCGYRPTEEAFFCHRCGSRLQEPRRY